MKRNPGPLHAAAVSIIMMVSVCLCPVRAEFDPAFSKFKEFTSSMSMSGGKNAPKSITDLIDNSINPESYFIGGGDVFSIHIVELPSVEYIAVVDQNCDAIISDLGVIRIGKKTLSQAKTMITDFVTTRLKKSYEVYVSLSRAKSAVVSVTGAISNPGTYQVEGTYRLFDVVRLANNHITPNPADIDYRQVQCVNRDSVKTYDVFKFLFCNDTRQNPYVYPGDNICISMASRRAYIAGNVKNFFTGFLPIKPDETVKDFLSLFTLEGSADSNNIIVTKHNEDGSARSRAYSMNRPQEITLADKDMVFVEQKSNYPRVETVMISGEVNRPGPYPIVQQVTTGRDLIEQAGGPTRFGNIKRAFLIRRAKVGAIQKSLNPPQPYSAQQIQMRPVTPTVRPEITAALSSMSASNDFSIIPLRDATQNALLETNDEVVVPKIENIVYVSGNVKSPGAYPFADGQVRAYYIKKAGGFTSKADRSNVFILTQYSEMFQLKGGDKVEDGDVIVAPESQQYKYLSTVLLPLVGIVLSAISTIILLYSVTHPSGN